MVILGAPLNESFVMRTTRIKIQLLESQRTAQGQELSRHLRLSRSIEIGGKRLSLNDVRFRCLTAMAKAAFIRTTSIDWRDDMLTDLQARAHHHPHPLLSRVALVSAD